MFITYSRLVRLTPRDARLVLIALMDPSGLRPFSIYGDDRRGYSLWLTPESLTWLIEYPSQVVSNIVHNGLVAEPRGAAPFDSVAFRV
jgi:hypothetical protein